MADQLTPHSAEHTTIDSSAGPLAALIASPPVSTDAPDAPGPTVNTDAPVVLLVPGYTGSKEDFAPIIDPLAEAGFMVIAIDQPGQNESPGPSDEAAYASAALGPVLTSVIRPLAAVRPVVLLGHSFGGLVSRAAVLDGAAISGLVLLCSGPSAFVSGNRFESLTKGEPVLRSHGAAVLYDGMQTAAGLDPQDPDPLQQFLRARFLATSEHALIGMATSLLTETDRTSELAAALRAIGAPVAVIAGVADDAWPLDAQGEMARTLGTELILVPEGAHSPAIEAPENLVAVLVPLITGWLAAGRSGSAG